MYSQDASALVRQDFELRHYRASAWRPNGPWAAALPAYQNFRRLVYFCKIPETVPRRAGESRVRTLVLPDGPGDRIRVQGNNDFDREDGTCGNGSSRPCSPPAIATVAYNIYQAVGKAVKPAA